MRLYYTLTKNPTLSIVSNDVIRRLIYCHLIGWDTVCWRTRFTTVRTDIQLYLPYLLLLAISYHHPLKSFLRDVSLAKPFTFDLSSSGCNIVLRSIKGWYKPAQTSTPGCTGLVYPSVVFTTCFFTRFDNQSIADHFVDVFYWIELSGTFSTELSCLVDWQDELSTLLLDWSTHDCMLSWWFDLRPIKCRGGFSMMFPSQINDSCIQFEGSFQIMFKLHGISLNGEVVG